MDSERTLCRIIQRNLVPKPCTAQHRTRRRVHAPDGCALYSDMSSSIIYLKKSTYVVPACGLQTVALRAVLATVVPDPLNAWQDHRRNRFRS